MQIDKELEIMTTVGSMGGPDKETKGLDEIVVYRFPGNAPSMPILADPSNPDSAAEPLPWKTVTSFEMSKSSAPREGAGQIDCVPNGATVAWWTSHAASFV